MREVRTITKHEELKAISEHLENLDDRQLHMVLCFISGLLRNSVPSRKQNEETPGAATPRESR